MTPTELADYLRVIKDAGVMSGRVVFNGIELNVIFGPEAPPSIGEVPQPGGWKGPERLDDHSTFELPVAEGPVT